MLQASEARPTVNQTQTDVLILGAGLTGGLLALWLKTFRPQASVRVLETLPGPAHYPERTWSFHGSDLEFEPTDNWIRSLPGLKSWQGYSVRFPHLGERHFGGSYHSFSSDALNHLLASQKVEVRWGATVKTVEADHVDLTSGEKLAASVIVDTRNNSPSNPSAIRGGFQKFVGLRLELEQSHGLKSPVIMDACCEQKDGYRFFYLLPTSEKELLIEDTYYSDTSELDVNSICSEIRKSVSERGWKIRKELKIESGVLPVPFSSPVRKSTHPNELSFGVGAGFYHPVTAYSFAWVARFLRALEGVEHLSRPDFDRVLQRLKSDHKRTVWFYTFMNRMLFLAVSPTLRYQLLEKFHSLPEGLVQRFYASKTNFLDRLQILATRPALNYTQLARFFLWAPKNHRRIE